MHRFFLASAAVLGFAGGILPAQETSVAMPGLTVYSARVANQNPAGGFPTPVTALRFEPTLDIASRDVAENQADLTLRGGIFENSGVRIGSISLLDPQTGHYLAEIPLAPALLDAPRIFTGTENALNSLNANVGTVAYGFRKIERGGFISVGAGDHRFNRQEFYQGYVGNGLVAGRQIAADVAFARSDTDGTVPFGDHDFKRINGRVQLASASSQTDLAVGYQEKFFGWPNLYTPFNAKESENLQTVLFILNHRTNVGQGDFIEAGAFHRRNKDDYAFNRFAPLGPTHPFQHTTWASGGALGGRWSHDDIAWNFRGELQADELQSTSLTAGRYRTRTLAKLTLLPEKSWQLSDGSRAVIKAGGTFDDSNRTGAAGSPVLELARERKNGSVRRIYLSYAQSTQLPTYTALNSSAASGLFRGNADLGRETTHNVELGTDAALHSWNVQAAAFYRRDDALVDWTFRRGVTARTANAVDIATLGFEAVARRSWSVCDVVLGYTWLTKDGDYRDATVDASFYALNYAHHRLTAAFVVRLGHGVEVRLDNVARVQADNLLRQTGGDETLLSSLSVAFRPPAMHGLEFSVAADNLWNSNFQEVPAVPAPRRQLSVGLSYLW